MSDSTPPPVNPYEAVRPLSPANEKLWATLIHVGGIVGGFFSLGFLPSLIGYLVLKDRGPFIRQHTAAALNFQLTMLIAAVAGLVLSLVFIGILLIIAVGVVVIIFSIMAAMAANNGQSYTYPLSIRFVS